MKLVISTDAERGIKDCYVKAENSEILACLLRAFAAILLSINLKGLLLVRDLKRCIEIRLILQKYEMVSPLIILIRLSFYFRITAV